MKPRTSPNFVILHHNCSFLGGHTDYADKPTLERLDTVNNFKAVRKLSIVSLIKNLFYRTWLYNLVFSVAKDCIFFSYQSTILTHNNYAALAPSLWWRSLQGSVS